MKVNITIKHIASGKSINLDERQTRLLLVEMRRIKSYWAKYLDNVPGVAPEIEIIIDENGKSREFRILNNNILLNVKRKRVYQFYMGYEILDWLGKL